MIQRRIDMKQKEIKPYKQSLKEVEDHLTVLEALQCGLNLITDEEELSEIIAGNRRGSIDKLHQVQSASEDHIYKFSEGASFRFKQVSLASSHHLSL